MANKGNVHKQMIMGIYKLFNHLVEICFQIGGKPNHNSLVQIFFLVMKAIVQLNLCKTDTQK